METYAIKFRSPYTVVGYAVVVASNEMTAKDILMGQLKAEGLLHDTKRKDLEVIRVPKSQGVIVLFGR